MLKQTVTYTDFDDNVAVETLYFNLTKTELFDNLHLKDALEQIQEKFAGEPRSLSTEDIQEILNLVKTFMRLSYGVRSADGKRFSKKPELWEEFTETAAYDAFLISLFQDPEKAMSFLANILPADLRGEAENAMKEATVTELPKSNHNPGGTVDLPTAPPILESEEKDTNEGEISDEDLLKMKPQDMTPDQLRRAYALKTNA